MPILERNFLVDQRGNRKMAIAAVDHKETEKNIRNALRKERQIANANAFLNKSFSENTLVQVSSSSSTTLSDSSDIADDFEHFLSLSIKNTEKKKKTPDKTPCKRMKFPAFALACDRTGVSDRTAALLTSSLLKDIAPQRKEESVVVIDRSKVRRERSNERKFSDEEIDLFILEKRKWNIENFPCHTQAVERCIKLVTEASQSVCGENRRDGFIRSRKESTRTSRDFKINQRLKMENLLAYIP